MKLLNNILSRILSTRLWIMIILIEALVAHFAPELFTSLTLGEPVMLMFVTLVVAGIASLNNASTVYDVESDKAFVRDIILDVVFIVIATSGIIIGLYEEANAYVLVFVSMAFGVAIYDFKISLIGGASKLLEMDKSQITSSRTLGN